MQILEYKYAPLCVQLRKRQLNEFLWMSAYPCEGRALPFLRRTWYFLSSVHTAAPVQCPACSTSTPNFSHFHNIGETCRVLFFYFLPPLFFSQASLGCFYFFPRTCLTSCFLAGARTTTCPREWLIDSGWIWGRWSPRNSATRRHGEYTGVNSC